MKSHKLNVAGIVAVFLLASSSVNSAPQVKPAPATKNESPALSGSMMIQPPPSDKGKSKFAEELADEVGQYQSAINSRIDAATKAKDTALLNCLQDISFQMKFLLSVIETNAIMMQQAMAENNSGQVESKFTSLVLARGKAKTLYEKSFECTSEGGVFESGSGSDATVIVEDAPLIPAILEPEPPQNPYQGYDPVPSPEISP